MTKVEAIGFLILDRGHFSAVWIDTHGVFFADSLSHPPPDNLLSLLSWVFQGTSIVIPHDLNIVEVPQQSFSMGSGSCGIAAHNFIHRHAFGGVVKWEAEKSSTFRDAALVDLVLYHTCASQRSDVSTKHFISPIELYLRLLQMYADWVKPCHLPVGARANHQGEGLYSYEDFNLDEPLVSHFE